MTTTADTEGPYTYTVADGWIWHNKHGFFHVPSDATSESLWLYTQNMGWIWTGSTTYPFLYRHSDGVWLWYNGATNPRWFVNMATGHWESWP